VLQRLVVDLAEALASARSISVALRDQSTPVALMRTRWSFAARTRTRHPERFQASAEGGQLGFGIPDQPYDTTTVPFMDGWILQW
jgi:hypothetical protein